MRIQRQAFARLLATLDKVVENRNAIPILGTVRLIAGDGKLTATATDLDIEVSASIDAETPEAFTACIDEKLLFKIASKLDTDEVSIRAAEGGAQLVSGRSRYQLQTLPIDDFPTMAAGNLPTEFEADLSTLFAPVQFAISTEETRYYLNGIYLHVDGGHDGEGRLTAVATDGHRLARNIGQAVEDAAGTLVKGIIVPRKTVSLIPKGTIRVRLSDTKIQFATSDALITSKLIDGTFPDYKRILPTGNDKAVTFDIPAMKQAAERVSVISSERGRAVRLSFADDQAVLSVSSPEQGNATEEISVGYAGEPIEIGFNSAYLTEVCSQFPAGEVKMALADAGSPALLTSDMAEGLLAVLMPMRV